MNSFFRHFTQSKITQKVVKRCLLAGLIAIGFMICIYYQFYWKSLLKEALNTGIATNQEVANQTDNHLDSLIDTSRYILNSTDLRNRLAQYYREPSDSAKSDINLLLSSLISSMKNIRAVYIDGPEEQQFHSLDTLYDAEEAQFESDTYAEIRAGKHHDAYSSVYSVTTDATTYYLIAYFYNFNIGSSDFTMTIFFDASSMIETVENLTDTLFNGCVLTNSLSETFFSYGDVGSITEISKENYTFDESSYFQYERGYYFFSQVETPGWNIVSYISYQKLFATFMREFVTALVLCIVLTLFLIILLVPLLYKIIHPIHDLSNTMQAVTDGNLECYSAISTDDEIGDLSRVFNQMIDSLNRHIETILEYQSKEQRMIYNLLIAQIDTHFIYNTMSIINSFARKGMTQEIITANSALIKIMQNCLRVKALDVTDTIEQEIDVVRQYWIIEKMRYDMEANLIWDVPVSLYEEKIPKNLIQPVVENCLFHGLVDEDTGTITGSITVTIRKDFGNLMIRISDTGCGFSENLLDFYAQADEKADRLSERGKHIGLTNIRQRLYYIYGGKAKTEFYNDSGAVVKMFLPAEESKAAT